MVMFYRVDIKRNAQKQLAKLSSINADKIVKEIRALANNPRPNGCKKLVGSENTYRIRLGDYRIIYSIFENRLIVQVIKIGHRKDIYK